MTTSSKTFGAALSVVAVAAAAFASSAFAQVSQSGEQKNMRRIGHTDLQGRPAYQPNTIVYPDGRTIAFVGTHGGSKPNPLKGTTGGVVDKTMPIDQSNVALYNPATGKADRVGIKVLADGKKVRVFKSSGEEVKA